MFKKVICHTMVLTLLVSVVSISTADARGRRGGFSGFSRHTNGLFNKKRSQRQQHQQRGGLFGNHGGGGIFGGGFLGNMLMFSALSHAFGGHNEAAAKEYEQELKSNPNIKEKTPIVNLDNATTITLTQVKEAISKGESVYNKDKNGMTALMYASVGSKDPAVVKYLIDQKANVYAKDKQGWDVLSHTLVNNKNDNRWQNIKVLLDGKAKVTPKILKYINSKETDGKVISLFNKYQ